MMNKRTLIISLILLSTISLVTYKYIFSSEVQETGSRPTQWAQAISGTELDNFYKIDEGVYRSKQPDENNFKMLEVMGIKEVLNLRHHHSDTDEAQNTNLNLHQIKLDAGSITEDHLIESLSIIKNRKGPIVFHCWHGSDRTGAVAAAYRIIYNDWSKADAIDELINGGYGYHEGVYGNIKELLENLDVVHVKHHLNN